jgi:hypothetical protein
LRDSVVRAPSDGDGVDQNYDYDERSHVRPEVRLEHDPCRVPHRLLLLLLFLPPLRIADSSALEIAAPYHAPFHLPPAVNEQTAAARMMLVP